MSDRGNGAGGNAQLIAEYLFEELPGPLGIGVRQCFIGYQGSVTNS
jgi:hypothetical protein